MDSMHAAQRFPSPCPPHVLCGSSHGNSPVRIIVLIRSRTSTSCTDSLSCERKVAPALARVVSNGGASEHRSGMRRSTRSQGCAFLTVDCLFGGRSEERRVGKECSRGMAREQCRDRV